MAQFSSAQEPVCRSRGSLHQLTCKAIFSIPTLTTLELDIPYWKQTLPLWRVLDKHKLRASPLTTLTLPVPPRYYLNTFPILIKFCASLVRSKPKTRRPLEGPTSAQQADSSPSTQLFMKQSLVSQRPRNKLRPILCEITKALDGHIGVVGVFEYWPAHEIVHRMVLRWVQRSRLAAKSAAEMADFVLNPLVLPFVMPLHILTPPISLEC
ncbi:hypothetical protein EJ05DRAFT_512267 [Pseudovirgaria hyperparasitica]|uniref:Uncharacterized protein n=1 Tax=Pseudovirgaria hyperparasitica TaxID=470096 RepID=A0A6A6W501_9PEZI|nr:uncharacterized protein EJ05DRAFT_512267 [Pseudovirgaria hyperparasitica]KAF2756637.1 hypothetical protein EJ05DRAFT_512267 [Pseudovirgaria hyperparasitica]